MTAYRIRYQLRRQKSISMRQGDWQDRESVVLSDNDARDAVEEVSVNHCDWWDFRLIDISSIARVDMISKVIRTRINQ